MDIPQSIRDAIERAPVLNKQQERELIEKSKAGDGQAREALVLANLRWVWKLAERHKRRGMSADDLFQLGITGLLRGIDGFNLAHNVRLTTYATFWIRQRIMDEIETKSAVISVPKRQNREKLTLQKDRDAVAMILKGIASLDTGHNSNRSSSKHSFENIYTGDYTLLALANSEALRICEDLLESLERRELSKMVKHTVWKLPHSEKLVVWLRMRNWSLSRVSQVMRISQEGARKIEIRAHARLKEQFEFLGLDRF